MNILKKLKLMYGKWSLTTKLFFYMGVIGLILPLIPLFIDSNRTTNIIYRNPEFNSSVGTKVIQNTSYCYAIPKDAKKGKLKEGTIVFWIKPDLFLNYGKKSVLGLIGKEDKTLLQTYLIDNRIVSLKLIDANGQEFVLSYDNKEVFTNWSQLILTWGEDNINLYVNGKSKNKLKLTDANLSLDFKNIVMGSMDPNIDCMYGRWDEIYIFANNFDKYDVKTFYNEGKGCTIPLEKCVDRRPYWSKVLKFFRII